MIGVVTCASALMPCDLSSALVMGGCRGLGLNGAMVPLVLCGQYVCSPEQPLYSARSMAGEPERAGGVIVARGRSLNSVAACDSADVRDSFLSLRLGCGSRLCLKLEHCCFLIFKQVS